jgi:hypothetical protein
LLPCIVALFLPDNIKSQASRQKWDGRVNFPVFVPEIARNQTLSSQRAGVLRFLGRSGVCLNLIVPGSVNSFAALPAGYGEAHARNPSLPLTLSHM